jgi:hypothetical protein
MARKQKHRKKAQVPESSEVKFVTCFEQRKGWPAAPFQARFIAKEGSIIKAVLKGIVFMLPAALCSMEQDLPEENRETFMRRARLSLGRQLDKPFDPITGARL